MKRAGRIRYKTINPDNQTNKTENTDVDYDLLTTSIFGLRNEYSKSAVINKLKAIK